jgi:hypothetical protein
MQLAAPLIVAFGAVGALAAAQLFASEPTAELTKYRLAPPRSGRSAKPAPSTPFPTDVS